MKKNKEELLHILEQLSVKVWSNAKKSIDMESVSLMKNDMMTYLKLKPSTIKELMEKSNILSTKTTLKDENNF